MKNEVQKKEPVKAYQQLEELDKFAEFIVNSDTFGKSFDKVVKTQVEGKEVIETVRNKHDVIACIILGAELGIDRMASIMLGKSLDANAYRKIEKGRSLGLDVISSLQNISIIPTGNGDIIHTGVHVIAKVLLDAGITLTFLEDFSTKWGYFTADGRPLDEDIIFDTRMKLLDKFFLVTNANSKEEVAEAVQNKKVIITRRELTKVTTGFAKRKGEKDGLKISYTLQQATDAGLYRGYDSELKEADGTPVYYKGKSNWNSHPATMLRNRVIALIGRIIAADRLQGMYLNEEAAEITNTEIKVEDVIPTIVENEEIKTDETDNNIEEAQIINEESTKSE